MCFYFLQYSIEEIIRYRVFWGPQAEKFGFWNQFAVWGMCRSLQQIDLWFVISRNFVNFFNNSKFDIGINWHIGINNFNQIKCSSSLATKEPNKTHIVLLEYWIHVSPKMSDREFLKQPISIEFQWNVKINYLNQFSIENVLNRLSSEKKKNPDLLH